MRRYTATWGLNLVPDPAEEVHESIYECAPTEIEGEDFAAAAAKVERMAALDAQMTVPMDDKTGWTTWLPNGNEFPKERRSPHHRDDPDNQAEPPLFAFLRINLIPDTDALKAAEFWESFDPFTVNGVAQTRDWADETVMIDYIYTDPTINTRPIDQNLVEEYAESMIQYAAESDDPDHWQRQWRDRPKIVASGYLFGGFHTVAAAKLAFGKGTTIGVRVYRGSRHNAYLMATGENYEHGRRRTREEVHNNIKRWLLDEEGKTWANRHIAEMCKTSHMTVSRVEDALAQDDSNYTRPDRRRMLRDGQEVWIDTEKIGGKTEEELPLLDLADANQDSSLTELYEDIERTHDTLYAWYTEGNDLEPEDRHFSINELRAEYAELFRAWKHRESAPIDNLGRHREKLEQIYNRRHDAGALHETARSIIYHRQVMEKWFMERHMHSHTALAVYCTDYATTKKGFERHRLIGIFTQLVADQHQLPIELLTCQDAEFLWERDLEELQNSEQLLSETVESLKQKGLDVPSRAPKMEAPDNDQKRKIDTRPSKTAPPGAALNDDETPAQKHDPETMYLNFEVAHVPTVVEFVDTEEAWAEVHVTHTHFAHHCREDCGESPPTERVVAALKRHRRRVREYVDALDELARVIEKGNDRNNAG